MEKKYNFYDKNLIGHIEIKNLDCFYFTRYYPTSKYGYNENQEFIFNFKDGTCPEIYAQIFSRAILNLFKGLINTETNKVILEDTIILPVPASTQEKHKMRYQDLFKLISEKTGVGNGYEYIKIKNDVEAKHLNNNRTSLEKHIEIDYSFMKNYTNIILIDDVITTGKSISDLANKFRNLKVLQEYVGIAKPQFIIGLVLGKTFNQLDLLNDELIDEKIVSNPDSTFKLNSFNNLLELDPIDIIKGIDIFHYDSFGVPDIRFIYRKDPLGLNRPLMEKYEREHLYIVFHQKFSVLNEKIINKD
jgi:hypothetical protein